MYAEELYFRRRIAYLNVLLSSIWTKFAHSFINDPIISGRINVKINKERINGYLYTTPN
jgi:hypothetical protein